MSSFRKHHARCLKTTEQPSQPRTQEHVSNVLDSGKAMDRVVFQEIHSGEIFGFDSFLTGAPAYSSIVVDSEKAVVSLTRRAPGKPEILVAHEGGGARGGMY